MILTELKRTVWKHFKVTVWMSLNTNVSSCNFQLGFSSKSLTRIKLKDLAKTCRFSRNLRWLAVSSKFEFRTLKSVRLLPIKSIVTKLSFVTNRLDLKRITGYLIRWLTVKIRPSLYTWCLLTPWNVISSLLIQYPAA